MKTLSADELREARGIAEDEAPRLAGNWQKFQCFCWYEQPEDPENWAIIYTSNRDSCLLEQSNAAVYEKALSRFPRTAIPQSHNHWAVGYVDGYVLRVYDRRGRITKAFQVYAYLKSRENNYPILDENDYCNREYEATLANIRSAGRQFVKDGAPPQWPSLVYGWLSENNERELENRDDQGGYPSDDALKEALTALAILNEGES